MDPPLIDVDHQQNIFLLRMLQSMKRIEDDPSNQFQTDNLDFTTFTPKYPNIALVDQSFPEEFKAIRTSEALSLALPPNERFIGKTLHEVMLRVIDFQGAHPTLGGWTIILKEGLFINPLVLLGQICASHGRSRWIQRCTNSFHSR